MTNANVAILAGGMGTRLLERSQGKPKAMVKIAGKPLLQHQIELCRTYGFTKIALLLGYQSECIQDHFKDGSTLGVSLTYSIERYQRGTAGALRDALPILQRRFLLLYGDTFMDVDLQRFWQAHDLSGAVGTVFLHPNDHPQDSDLVEIDDSGDVRGFLPHPHPEGLEARNLVNAALYVLNRNSLEDVTPTTGSEDIAKHMFPRMLSLGWRLRGYVSPEYIKDMGTPERLDAVERDLLLGRPERLSCRGLRNAVFLDRDGTINREVSHLKLPDEIDLLPGAAMAIRRLNQSGNLVVVVTNQPVLARGEVTLQDLNRIHMRLERDLGAKGAYLDGIYVCPHHPDTGFAGEIVKLKGPCSCRKPEPGLIDLACHELKISREDSWMVGDSTSDIMAGRLAGLRTVLLCTGYAGSDRKCATKPDYIAISLKDAVDWILIGHAELKRKVANIAVEASLGKRTILIGGLARAGKSYTAQVLKELLHTLGRKAHVISLDGWLRPRSERQEGVGVVQRYDLCSASAEIAETALSTSRKKILEPLYHRVAGNSGGQFIEHSVGPEDVLIVEGVPALITDALLCLPKTLRVYVNVKFDTRRQRLREEYDWRSISLKDQTETLAMREIDETPIIEQSKFQADFIVQ